MLPGPANLLSIAIDLSVLEVTIKCHWSLWPVIKLKNKCH